MVVGSHMGKLGTDEGAVGMITVKDLWYTVKG